MKKGENAITPNDNLKMSAFSPILQFFPCCNAICGTFVEKIIASHSTLSHWGYQILVFSKGGPENLHLSFGFSGLFVRHLFTHIETKGVINDLEEKKFHKMLNPADLRHCFCSKIIFF